MPGTRSFSACLLALCLITACTPPPAHTSVPEASPSTAATSSLDELGLGGTQDQAPKRWHPPSAPSAPSAPPAEPTDAGRAVQDRRCIQGAEPACLLALTPAPPGRVPPPSGIDAPAVPATVRAYLLAVLRDLNRKWVAWFDGNGFGKPEVYYTIILEGKTHPSNCRNPAILHRIAVEHDHPNAYYCPVDPYDPVDPTGPLGTSDSDNGMIILPVTTLQRLWDADRGSGGNGDFALALVLAHEFGHHVQDELAIHWFEKFQVPIPEFTGAHKELIADCFAGAWAASWQAPGSLDAPAVDQALASVAAMGTIRSGVGYGSGWERREAFLLGAAGKGSTSGPQACLSTYWG